VVADRTRQMMEEKKKADTLLYRMLPAYVHVYTLTDTFRFIHTACVAVQCIAVPHHAAILYRITLTYFYKTQDNARHRNEPDVKEPLVTQQRALVMQRLALRQLCVLCRVYRRDYRLVDCVYTQHAQHKPSVFQPTASKHATQFTTSTTRISVSFVDHH